MDWSRFEVDEGGRTGDCSKQSAQREAKKRNATLREHAKQYPMRGLPSNADSNKLERCPCSRLNVREGLNSFAHESRLHLQAMKSSSLGDWEMVPSRKGEPTAQVPMESLIS